MSVPRLDPVDDARPLVRRLGKPPEEWRRADLVDLCMRDGIRVVNFRYPGLDSKLKELRIPVSSRGYVDRALAAGERVDGSSLFPGVFDPTQSDLYVVPVYRWAFLNPWADDELDIVCRFADPSGEPCASTPDNVLAAAAERMRERTGAELLALAEPEFYLFVDGENPRFTSKIQRNYHQSAPYLRSRPIADQILRVVSDVTGRVKYCHSETGYMDRITSDEPEIDGRRVEQYELEFDLMPVEDLGCWLSVARALIRVIADRHGASVSYLPKLDEGMAGSGMHLHLALARDGRNVMAREGGGVSDDAHGMIGAFLRHAAALTAFGNTVAASYLRLVPGQEAPTRVCWGARNRAGLVRVPLAFDTPSRLDRVMNPREDGSYPEGVERPTIEYRSPDGSGYPHLLLAAVTMCAAEGVGSPDAVALARRLEVKHERAKDLEGFDQLPPTAVAAAHALARDRAFFEEQGMSSHLIDIVIRKLEDERDEGLGERLRALPAAERLAASRRLMHKDLHKH